MHRSATDSDCGAATETAAEKYLRNERVGSSVAGEVSATVVYVLDPTRSHDVPESHFGKAVSGVLIVDRYSAYKAMRQVKMGQLLLAFCWVHVRRDFVRVGKGYPELKDWALAWLLRIRELYCLNRDALVDASHPARKPRQR